MSADLVAFLRAQLDAEAALARRVANRYRVRNPDRVDDGRPYWPLPSVAANLRNRATEPGIAAGLDLIEMYSPARVLAEVDAKRRILDEHLQGHTYCRTCPPLSGCAHTGPSGWPPERIGYICPTIRLLALPYAGHADYREEWRP